MPPTTRTLRAPRRLPAGLACALALLAALACSRGRSAPEPAEGHYQRLELSRASAAPATPEREVLRVDGAGDASRWNADAPHWAVEPLGEGEGRALRLFGGERHELRLQGPFEGDDANLLEVDVVAHRDLTLRAALLRDGAVALPASDFAFVRVGEARRCSLDLRDPKRRAGHFDELVLYANAHGEGPDLDWSFVAARLVERPAASWLPRVGTPGLDEDDAGLVEIEGDARRGIGLAAGHPLAARARVPARGKLAFAYGWPRHMGARGGTATLAVTVDAGQGSTPVERFELGSGFERAPRWREASIPLERWAGREVTIAFSLEAPGDPEAACGLAEACVVAPGKAATVLLVTSDTHRGDHLGSAGRGVVIETPVLDALASEGVVFRDCFASSDVTIPSHVALMTGLHPRDTGVIDNQTPLAERAVTLAERFREAGYATWAVVSARHLEPSWSGLGQGFDRVAWPSEREAEGSEALARLEGWLPASDGRPLFVWMHLFDAHRPYEPPERYERRYYPADRDPLDPSLPDPDFLVPPWLPGLRDPEWCSAEYRGEVSYVDELVGRALALPRVRDAVVAFTADHGECLGQHGIYWNHVSLYPDTVHVPLIVRGRSVPAGVRVEAPVRQWDVGRTLLDLAGLIEAPFPGSDLLALARGAPSATEPRFAISQFGHAASINTGRWHLLLHLRRYPKNAEHPEWGEFEAHAVELYDLEADRACEHDLVSERFELAARLRAELVEWLLAAPEADLAGQAVDSEGARELLGQLGYATGEGARRTSRLFDADCSCEHCEPFAASR